MKRMSGLLALVLVLSVMLGCVSATAQGDEAVTIYWYFYGNGVQKDTELVNDRVNELIQKVEGMEQVSVKLMPFDHDVYSQQVLLAQVSGDPIDIVGGFGMSTWLDDIRKGTFLPMDALLPLVPDLTNELPDWLLDYGRVDGELYYIPNYQQATNIRMLGLPEAYAKYADIEAMADLFGKGYSGGSTIAEEAALIESYIQAAREGEGRDTLYLDDPRQYFVTANRFYSMDALRDNFMYNYALDRVEYQYANDWVKEVFEIAGRWNEAGYFHPEAMTYHRDDFVKKNMMNDVAVVLEGNHYAMELSATLATMNKLYGFDMAGFQAGKSYLPFDYAARGNAITASSQHPEVAIQILDLMNTKKGAEIYNTVVYGIEGRHYEKIDDTHIKTLEYDSTQAGPSTSYSAHKWVVGNTFNAYLNQACVDGQNEFILEYVNNSSWSTVSPLIGFRPDITGLENELSQCKAVTEEYQYALVYGAMGADWETYYQEYETKLKNAGMDKVIEVLSEQVAAFLAAN